MFLLFFEWLDQTALAQAIHASKWAFAAAETVHLLCLTALGGAVLVANLRVLGFGLQQQEPRQVAQQLNPVFWTALAGAVLSGTLMVVGEALKCYNHPAFRIKMILFVLALLLSGLIQRRLRAGVGLTVGLRALAVLNLAVWFSTGFAGRAVGFI